ncbi:MAG: 2-aminoethylphosphonate ABC transporter substrate-binding protein, partial [Rhodospirillales bacterium]|nr:2-aminoethylphosphonate ABC transporter substrate-binding protein [Rhodospirillales bacterium]
MRLIKASFAAALVLAGAPALAQAQTVTIYSADGLHDGTPNWYQTEFDAFAKATGIKVQYVEAGSGVVVNRVAMQKANQQADVLVTLPPFIQAAAAQGLLAPYTPAEAAAHIPAATRDPKGEYWPMVNDYLNFIYDASALSAPPAGFADLLAPKFKGKIQYSTPGEAGDGTAVMLQVIHAYGSKQAGFAYLAKLQANNVGPSSSTGRLTALVNKGELDIANGDLQMNLAQQADDRNIRIFFPAGPDGVRSTFAIPYDIALVAGAPHPAAAKKLIDFLLSKAAQEQVSSIAYGYPVRDDVHPTDAKYQAFQAALDGVTIWNPDWNAVLASLKSDIATWHKVTG